MTLSSITQHHLSEKAFEEAKRLMPGGVNSPVRAFKSVGGQPVFLKKAKGPYVWDIDDNCYIDYVGSWGPAILGHADPDVVRKVQAVAENGLSFGAPTLLENELAKLVIACVPSIEKVRFVNSGTEAVMSTVRLARAFTGRNKIIKFAGCYHGHMDSLLVKAGSGVATLGIPDSLGIPAATASDTLIAHFNDLASVRQLLSTFPKDIAGILVEPIAGNMGCVPPEPGFLEGLRLLADEHGTLLIFDEVMTGFRVSLGGAQERYDILPDITALGKIIGGGLPAAAYGGKAEIMAMVAPEGSMYQAGTLSGNPLAMACGLATLEKLKTPGFYQNLEEQSTQLAEGLLALSQKKGVPACIHQVGSMITLFFTETPVKDYNTALSSNREQYAQFFRNMLEYGVYLAPSQFECAFLSITHQKEEIETTLRAAEKSLSFG